MASRITNSMMYGQLFGNMQMNLASMLNLQEQMSTQRKFFKPSDDPIAVARGLNIGTSIFENTQYIKNQEDAVSWLKASDTAFNQLLTTAQRIRELTIYAGDGALTSEELKAISTEIQQLKEDLRNTANTSIAGKYLFSGLDTATRPFSYDAFGRIVYGGSNNKINFEIERGVTSEVSFAGSEFFQKSEKTYNVKSQYVPIDWTWKGREEKVQIRLGETIVKIQIPELWIDEVASGNTKSSDFNQFRDPDEVRGLTMDQVAELFSRSLKQGGADKLISVKVEKDAANGVQRLVFTSNTGEPMQITGWPDTDMAPMEQSIAGLPMTTMPDWSSNTLIGDAKVKFPTNPTNFSFQLSVGGGALTTINASGSDMATLLLDLNGTAGPPVVLSKLPANVTARDAGGYLVFEEATGKSLRVDGAGASALFGTIKSSELPVINGLMGEVNTLGWVPDKLNKTITISIGTDSEIFELDKYSDSKKLVDAINQRFLPKTNDIQEVATLVNGRIVLKSARKSTDDPIDNIIKVWGNGTEQLFGIVAPAATPITGTESSIKIKVGNISEDNAVQIFINDGDKLADIAKKIEAVTGMAARVSPDGTQLVFVAKRDTPYPEDMLMSDDAAQALAYPKFTIRASGAALQLFDFQITPNGTTDILQGVTASQAVRRPTDHSHIDLLDYLGMETTLKSVEFPAGKTLDVVAPLHWRVMSGNNQVDLKLAPGQYTMEQIAERLRNAGLGWLEVTVDVATVSPKLDATENGLGTSNNYEAGTSRLVIKAVQNMPVTFLDVNGEGYADKMGLSTAIRTDNPSKNPVEFPTAACLDGKTPAYLKVVIGDGKTYTVKLNQKDVGIAGTNPVQVDRNKVMEQIAKQVNEQSGMELVRVIKDAAPSTESSIFTTTGEPMMITDLPVPDSSWGTHTMGIAMQMGIHAGITATPAMKDSQTITAYNATTPAPTVPIIPGTIRIRSLGRSIDIDVTVDDTVKSILDKIRDQAGSWLEVNYFDPEMSVGGSDVMFAISARDGSPVSIYDIAGNVAQVGLKSDNVVNGTVDLNNPLNWTNPPFAPNDVMTITVAGYSHTIDLYAMQLSVQQRNNAPCTPQDLVDTINARFQDEDVRAEIDKDGQLNFYSPRGYKINVDYTTTTTALLTPIPTSIVGGSVNAKAMFPLVAATDTSDFTVTIFDVTGAPRLRNINLAGPNLDSTAALLAINNALMLDNVKAHYSPEGYLVLTSTDTPPETIRIADAAGTVNIIGTPRWTATGTNAQRGGPLNAINSQLNTIRSGPNTSQANFFDVLDNLSATMEAENREALSRFLLPQIDRFIDNLLKCRASEGALENRYSNNIARFKTNEVGMTELFDSVMGIDLSKAATEFAMLSAMYQASLAVVSQIIQPSLVNFLK